MNTYILLYIYVLILIYVSIYLKGSTHASADDLLEAVTGSKLKPEVFTAYLNKKYTDLYGL